MGRVYQTKGGIKMGVKLVHRWQDILSTWMEDLGISNSDFLKMYNRTISKWGNILDMALRNDHTALKEVGSSCDFCKRAAECEECIVVMVTGKRCTQLFEIIRQRHVWALKDHEEVAMGIAQVLGTLAHFYGHIVEALSEEE